MTVFGGERDEGQDHDEDEPWDEAQDDELDLDEDEPLPWLESSDYGEEETVDTARIVGFVSLALVVLALLVGGFWYMTNRSSGSDVVADGSTIAAPEGPAKVRPADPGGKEFEGTGDVAPAVGEGQTREGRLADAAASQPAAPAADLSPAPSKGGESSATGGAYVQVGALSSKAGADQRWGELTRRTEALSGFRYRVEEARIDNGTVYRVQAVAGDRAAANRLCDALKAEGIECIVK